MLYLKKLRLKNYCNYVDHTFNFTKNSNDPYKITFFYGPNGIGKSSCLDAIAKLTMSTSGRTITQIQQSLRKYIRNEDYDPVYERLHQGVYDKGVIVDSKPEKLESMLVEGVYDFNGNEYIVQLDQNGYLRNDFAPVVAGDVDDDEKQNAMNSGPWGNEHLKHRQRIAHYITSDSDLSMSKFQLHISQTKNFENIISEIMRYKVECVEQSGTTSQDRQYCTDFVIHKNKHRIHFKRMSAGEKKIAKSFSQILNVIDSLENPSYSEQPMVGWPPILLIDNIVMHVYYDRHATMIECIKKIFTKQQIFASTHSGILIQRYLNNEHDKENELMIDLEKINVQ